MAVNVFEDLVRGALNAQGYLTFENAAYRLHDNAKSLVGRENPSNNTPSDIDIIAFAPKKSGAKRVFAVNCKGSSEPLVLPRDAERIAGKKGQTVVGCSPQTGFRELCDPDWAKAFRACVFRYTGETTFTHLTVVRQFEGARTRWTQHEPFHALTPHLMLWSLEDVVQKLRQGAARLHSNNSTLKIVDLLYRVA